MPWIEGDVTHIKQILMNIVGSAAKFTPEDKWIKLSVNQRKTDDTHMTAFFRCEDTGSEEVLSVYETERGPPKVLIAEDMEMNAAILLKILTIQDFETARAKNGQEALGLFQSSAVGEFDVILMDLQMPVMDGCTVASEIRRPSRANADSVLMPPLPMPSRGTGRGQ